MKILLQIGHHELRRFLRRPSAYVWLFVVPLGFAYLMSFAAPKRSDPANRLPPVQLENADTGAFGAILVEELEAQGLSRINPSAGQKSPRTLRIPEDFSQRILLLQPVKVVYGPSGGAPDADDQILEARLVRALVRFNALLLESAQGGVVPSLSSEAVEALQQQPDPVRLDSRFAGRRPIPSGLNFSLPGNLVLYLLMNLLIFGGSTVASLREAGTLRRLLVHPVTRLQVVAGLLYGVFLLGMVQSAGVVGFGTLVLGLDLGEAPGAVWLLLAIFSWAAAALGVLAGSILSSADRVVGVSVVLALMLGALGGCWFPMEIAPESLQTVALGLPTAWALKGLHAAISFGLGWEGVWQPVLALGAFAAAATLAAARWFRV